MLIWDPKETWEYPGKQACFQQYCNTKLHCNKLLIVCRLLHTDVFVFFSKYPKMGDIDHYFVAHDWLTHIGLSQYSFTFETQMVDGRLLSSITRKDIGKYLNITSKFHQVTFLFWLKSTTL